MKYNELTLNKHKVSTRAGRGISAGRGKTAGRGTKGQGARKSGGVRPGFEGGQMPVFMRLPKLRGFKSGRAKNEIVYTGQLNSLKKSVVGATELFEAGLIKSPYSNIKLLVGGKLDSAKQVNLPASSRAAAETLKKAGGSFNQTARLARTVKKEKKK